MFQKIDKSKSNYQDNQTSKLSLKADSMGYNNLKREIHEHIKDNSIIIILFNC